ncbi:MAG: PEP-CTERM sorting domain-containing protein [Kiritimatiellae bacterium]|nr:PEP-CTERM sorting domain-containing protein [Kiritimatiellia bacterium]
MIYFRIEDNVPIVYFDGTETTWDSSYRSAEGYAIDSARVVVTGGNLADETPLILGYISGNTVVNSGADEIALDETPPPQTMFAFITDYASAEYSFAIELGSYDSREGWTTLATSASLTYQQLQTGDGTGGSYITTYDATVPTPQGIWAPQAYNVPEPSSGLLVLIGAGLLALRRGRARAPHRRRRS